MAKIKTSYICQECGYISPKWLGQCPECKNWNSFNEEKTRESKTARKLPSAAPAMKLSQIKNISYDRITSDISEFDRMIGGGFIPGEVVLLAGEPGIGKSTILMQIARNISSKKIKTVYVSSEESLEQQKVRAERLNISGDDIYFMSETAIELIMGQLESINPDLIVIDSIQSCYSADLESAPGTVSQVREVAMRIIDFAKRRNTVAVIVGHVTKEGVSAGPKTLEHMVDAVLYFEGDRHHQFRIIRPYKNRFGSTSEIGLFEMRSEGLFEIDNPASFLINERPVNSPGSVISVINEGTRAILIEVQALVTPCKFGIPKRLTLGYDAQRILMIVAVLEKIGGFFLSGEDIFVNLIGGIKVREPAVDLAVAAAVISSFKNKLLNPGAVIMGEVGLTGEVRSIPRLEERLAQARKLGFETFFAPKSNTADIKNKKGLKGIRNIKEFIEGV